MKDILNNLPFNSYGDLFFAIKEGKATIKLLRSDCSQIASIKHPYFATLGLYIGFLVTMIFLVFLSFKINNYWLLLLVPINFILSSIISHIPKLKVVAWGILLLDLFVLRLQNFVLITCLDIICIQFFYDIWWNIVYKQAIVELQDNEEAFLWSWNRCGLSIEDCYGNVYSKFNEIIKNENNATLHKYVELSKIVMKKLNTESVDEAIEVTYSFYKEQGIDVDKVEIDENNKFTTLSKLVMLGLDTEDIDEAIKETKEFYDSQEEKVD